jgi:glycerol transport system ATP-binding protein
MTLRLEGVDKIVGTETHLAGIDLTFEPGGFYVLLGPTLAGKTSLMRLMAGLDRPTRGRITVDGRDVAGVPVRKRNVAMVYQQFINYPSFTVWDNIASPLKRAGIDKAEVERRVQEAAETLKLTPCESAWGHDADRHHKFLNHIDFEVAAADADQQRSW